MARAQAWTLGEIKNLLAGLRCALIRELPLPDAHPCEITTALEPLDGRQHCYLVAIEFEMPRMER